MTASRAGGGGSGSGVPASAATSTLRAEQRNADATCAKCGKAKCEHELPSGNYFDIKCAE